MVEKLRRQIYHNMKSKRIQRNLSDRNIVTDVENKTLRVTGQEKKKKRVTGQGGRGINWNWD